MQIICIGGMAQSGKDSLADCLTQILSSKGFKTLTLHHADYLKFICKQYFGWDGVKDEKGRTLLQYIGTDVARKKDPYFWVNVIKNFLIMFGQEYDFIFIPDCRFVSEIETYKEIYNTTSVRMHRPNFDNGLTEAQKNHESETALNNYSFDVTINCSSGMDNVMQSAKTFVEEVLDIDL